VEDRDEKENEHYHPGRTAAILSRARKVSSNARRMKRLEP
jgi:hypothetical protein